MKKVLVSWSGGVDSTYLIQDYFKKGYQVDTIYTEICNNTTKSIRELSAIEKMEEEYFKHYAFKHLGTISVDLKSYRSGHIPYAQPILFLMSLFYNLNNDYSEVAIGYIQNDDAISALPEIRKIWKSFQGNCYNDYKLPPLMFPLIKTSKITTYNELNPKIKSLVTWCESDYAEDKCGKCVPCKKMKYYDLFDTNVIETLIENVGEADYEI